MSLGKRLKAEREKRNWSQLYVAPKVGITNTVLSNYERDYRDPDTATLQKLAELYEVSVDYLLTGKTLEASETILDDPEFQHAMRSAQGFSKENKQRVLDLIEMIEELEKGRKPGDRQPRRKP